MGNPLTPDQVHSDIDFLENYLQRGYIGSYYIKKEIMDNVHLALLELKKRSLAPIEPNIFCENLIGILQVIPDAHFDIQLPKICGHGNYIKKELVDVGNNVAPITEKWLHKIQKTSHGVSVDIIGLPSFHTAGNIKDSEWQKFIGTPSFLYKKPFFIIDLRGNHGGSLDVFFPWVEQMISTKESFKLTYFQLKTTEAIQVQINGNESALKHTNDPEYRKYLLKNMALV